MTLAQPHPTGRKLPKKQRSTGTPKGGGAGILVGLVSFKTTSYPWRHFKNRAVSPL